MAFTRENFLAFLESASALMNENKQYLIDLDSGSQWFYGSWKGR